MSESYDDEVRSAIVPLEAKRILIVMATGAGAGLIVWGLATVLGNYILSGILCHGSAMVCGAANQYGEILASILAAGFGLFVMVRLQIFRPLLIVLATLVSLWGVVATASGLPWYGIMLSCIFLYAVSYAAFTWLARLRSFGLVLVLFVVLIAIIRYTLSL